MSIPALLSDQSLRLSVVVLPQSDALLLGLIHQTLPGSVTQPGIEGATPIRALMYGKRFGNFYPNEIIM